MAEKQGQNGSWGPLFLSSPPRIRPSRSSWGTWVLLNGLCCFSGRRHERKEAGGGRRKTHNPGPLLSSFLLPPPHTGDRIHPARPCLLPASLPSSLLSRGKRQVDGDPSNSTPHKPRRVAHTPFPASPGQTRVYFDGTRVLSAFDSFGRGRGGAAAPVIGSDGSCSPSGRGGDRAGPSPVSRPGLPSRGSRRPEEAEAGPGRA